MISNIGEGRPKSDMQRMREMYVHETLIIKGALIMKVPGGWIYRFTGNAVFVPEERK